MTADETEGAERDPSDAILMSRYADGDLNAFNELFNRYEGLAYAFFLGLTRSAERAQDLYQELFLRIHRARDNYDPSRSFRPWFFQIARRLFLDDAQRAFRSHEIQIQEWEPRCGATGSEDRVARREELRQLLRPLSAEERHLVVAAKVEGIDYAELAQRVHRSVNSVKKTVSRALQRIRADASFDTNTGQSAQIASLRRNRSR